jgi:hypothetical protein
MAVKACGAGRPYHGLNPSRRGRITRDAQAISQRSPAILGR